MDLLDRIHRKEAVVSGMYGAFPLIMSISEIVARAWIYRCL